MPPREGLPQPVVGAGERLFDRVEGGAHKDIAMGGASGDKMLGVEEDTSATPVPERVCVYFRAVLILVIGFVILVSSLDIFEA